MRAALEKGKQPGKGATGEREEQAGRRGLVSPGGGTPPGERGAATAA